MFCIKYLFIIEKCSSLTGDRNSTNLSPSAFTMSIEKCDSPTGDENIYPFIRAQNNKLY
ncbi:hypothetical protein HMPREF1547_00656 [Blautia sp. KLE 1732]|nr:hypothetical protein HMPREF1547_00656 [Blautia sp. KLE 1732]